MIKKACMPDKSFMLTVTAIPRGEEFYACYIRKCVYAHANFYIQFV